MSLKREMNDLRRRAERQGWTIELRRSGHLKWVPPAGGPFVFSPSTPSDVRGIRNTRAELRRHGLEV